MKISKYITLGAIAMLLGINTSCVGDLNVKPDDENKLTDLTTKDQWMGYFGSIYGNLIYEGNLTPSGVDGGAGIFSRCHWNLQELCADGASLMSSWNDPGYPDLKFDTWTSDNTWAFMCFQREATTARQCMVFYNALSDASKFFTEEEIAQMRAETLVIHSLCYYYMIDLFGKGPWVDANLAVGATPPTYDRVQLFDATVAQLNEVINSGKLKPAKEQEYGRVSCEAARMLLAKLYLNAEVYTGKPMYDKCAEQCKEIVKTIPTLAETYKYLFCMSNDKYAKNGGEIIWSLPEDELYAQSYGGTTYLSAGAFFADIDKEEARKLGNPNSMWNGLKMKPQLVLEFEPGDQRRLIYEGEFKLDVRDLTNNNKDGDGYMCVKYPVTYEDDYYNDNNKEHSIVFNNADVPLFRLADTFLMLAECQVRGVEDADPGFKYFNAVRDRAGLAPKTSVTLDDILHERTCELYWEGHRRSDLIRFDKFTGGNYLWAWKGGVYEGTSIDSYRNLFAIPYQYVSTVGQNPGY